MEASVLSPTSWEKRRAWIRQSRNWQTQVLEEEAAAALLDVPDPEPSSLDDVFQEGKILLDITQISTVSSGTENYHRYRSLDDDLQVLFLDYHCREAHFDY
jgi:hypothetical protein